MVEDRITDGKRIAELLASELTGLDHDALARLEVSNARSGATPTPEGTVAYRVTVQPSADSDVQPGDDGLRAPVEPAADATVGEMQIYPDSATLRLKSQFLTVSGASPRSRGTGLRDRVQEREDIGFGHCGKTETVCLRIRSGAAVKATVDVLATLDLSDGEDP